MLYSTFQIGFCLPEHLATDVRISLTCVLPMQLRMYSWIEFELIKCREQYEMNQIQISSACRIPGICLTEGCDDLNRTGRIATQFLSQEVANRVL